MENLKVTSERLENCQVALTVKVGEERVDQALRESARRLSHKVHIPGFRQGKVPYRVMLERFGKEALLGTVLDELAQEAYKEALDETDIKPIAKADIQDIKLDPLTIKVVVPVAPVVDLGNYRQIRLDPTKVTVGEADVQEVLEYIRQENAQQQPVSRPAQLGDLAIMAIKGMVDGKLILNAEKSLLLLANSPYPFPGFNEKLEGLEIGGEREFALALPDDFPNPDLAGKEVHFKVRLRDLKEQVLPDVDDDLARTVSNYDTVEELKEKLRQGLQAQAEREAEEVFTSKVLDAVFQEAKIEFPPMLLEEEVDGILEEREKRLQQEGLNLSDYLAMKGQSEEEYREEIHPLAEAHLKRALLLGKVVKLEGLEVSPEEMKSQDGVSPPPEEILLARKALQRLVAIAKGEMEEISETKVKSSVEES
ncbi:MAG: trigger factor [Chloroflexota bacterium]|nr:trigger factor [Chloroflexota bacterium]